MFNWSCFEHIATTISIVLGGLHAAFFMLN